MLSNQIVNLILTSPLQSLDQITTLIKLKSWHTLYPNMASSFIVLIHINFAEVDASFFSRFLLEKRGDSDARSAPGGPEIDDCELIFGDFGFELVEGFDDGDRHVLVFFLSKLFSTIYVRVCLIGKIDLKLLLYTTKKSKKYHFNSKNKNEQITDRLIKPRQRKHLYYCIYRFCVFKFSINNHNE